MNNIKTLTDLGLSEQESETYLTLLKLGGSNASIVAKEIGIKRTTIYAILKSLAVKGFASVYFKKNKRFYYPLRPHKLSGLFEKKLEDLNSMIPLLESIEKKQSQSIGLRFIETREELENFYNEVLVEYKNKEYRVIGNTNVWEGIDTDFFVQYRKQRAKNNIHTRLLLSSDSENINPKDKTLLREFKFLPEKYKFKSTIDIFNDRILIVSPELSSLAVVVAIPAMVDVFKSIFEMLWDLN